MPDKGSRSKIRGTIYKMQNARQYLVQDMYQIQYTWYVVYVYKVLHLVLVLVQVAFERTDGNTEGRMSSFFSSIICLLLLVAKSNTFGLFEEEGKMIPVFEIEIDILSNKNGDFGGVFNNSSRLGDIFARFSIVNRDGGSRSPSSTHSLPSL